MRRLDHGVNIEHTDGAAALLLYVCYQQFHFFLNAEHYVPSALNGYLLAGQMPNAALLLMHYFVLLLKNTESSKA